MQGRCFIEKSLILDHNRSIDRENHKRKLMMISTRDNFHEIDKNIKRIDNILKFNHE